MAKEEKKKIKRPTAQKRDIQNSKKRLANRIFKSCVRTAIRKFEESLTKGDEKISQDLLNDVYALMDKGVKNGVFKLNKASRTKSRLTAKKSAKS